MQALYPKSTVLKLLTKAQSNNKNDNNFVDNGLSALLRNQFHRADLFSVFSSLCGSKNFIIKLKSYQLAINNRTDSETVLLVNQALKDLSHPYWGISLVAFQFLFYSDDEDLVTSNVFFLLQNESTQRAGLNSLHYFPESWLRYESKILSLIKDTSSLTSCLQVLDLRVSSSPAQPVKQEIIGLIQKQLNSSMDIFLLNLIHFADASEGQLRTQLIELLEPLVNDLEPSVYFRSLLLMPDKLEESIFSKNLKSSASIIESRASKQHRIFRKY